MTMYVFVNYKWYCFVRESRLYCQHYRPSIQINNFYFGTSKQPEFKYPKATRFRPQDPIFLCIQYFYESGIETNKNCD